MKKGLSSSIGTGTLRSLIEKAGYFEVEEKETESLGSVPKAKRDYLMRHKSAATSSKDADVTYADVIDWLRETRGIVVEVVPCLTQDGEFMYCGKSTDLMMRTTKHHIPSSEYMDALEAVLFTCLNIV